jgi:prolipoprotein diacylglyceryltransferase
VEFTLLWAALTAVACGWVGLKLWPDRVPGNAFDRLIAAGVVGLVIGRLTAMIIQGISPVTSPADIIIVRGGVHTGAATIAFLATLTWSTRTTSSAPDALAPATLLALAGWHAGCLWRGACLGTPSELPWAWALDASAVTRHPVEIYASIALAVGALGVSKLGWRPGLRAGTALLIASAARLLTEPLRPSITGGPVGWYVAGILAGAAAIMAGPVLARSRSRAST